MTVRIFNTVLLPAGEYDELLARIAALEARIAEFEAKAKAAFEVRSAAQRNRKKAAPVTTSTGETS